MLNIEFSPLPMHFILRPIIGPEITSSVSWPLIGHWPRILFLIVPTFCSGSSQHRALKTRRCSGLDAWIVPAFCSRYSPHGAFKHFFLLLQIGCLDGPGVLFLKNEAVFWIGPNFLFVCFLTQCYYLHTSRESVSPICGIFTLDLVAMLVI